jgi:hypothetical protein
MQRLLRKWELQFCRATRGVQLSYVVRCWTENESDPMRPPMSDSDGDYLPTDDEEIDVVAEADNGVEYDELGEEDFVFLEAELDLPPPTQTEALALAQDYALSSDDSDGGAHEAVEANMVRSPHEVL